MSYLLTLDLVRRNRQTCLLVNGLAPEPAVPPVGTCWLWFLIRRDLPYRRHLVAAAAEVWGLRCLEAEGSL